MKTLCALVACVFFVSLPAKHTGAANPRHCILRVHAQAYPRDTEIFATSIRAQLSGKDVAIEKMPWISEQDVVAFSPYPARDGTNAALLHLDEHGRLVLDTL